MFSSNTFIDASRPSYCQDSGIDDTSSRFFGSPAALLARAETVNRYPSVVYPAVLAVISRCKLNHPGCSLTPALGPSLAGFGEEIPAQFQSFPHNGSGRDASPRRPWDVRPCPDPDASPRRPYLNSQKKCQHSEKRRSRQNRFLFSKFALQNALADRNVCALWSADPGSEPKSLYKLIADGVYSMERTRGGYCTDQRERGRVQRRVVPVAL
jgi:hypothetical protein